MSPRRQVCVVTGGGGGIGAAIAEELGRNGWFVVTVDPLVTLDGTETLPAPEETTAGRIVAAGGSARASSASVTDGAALHDLFGALVDEHGGLDAVVNVAGITRQSYFARGTEEDWLALLSVHLGGYLNVLDAALPLMAAAGHGRILGVTSGSGWRGGRRRRVQQRQAGRGGPHLAARWPGPAGRDGQRNVAHRQHPHGGRGAGAGPQGRARRGRGRTLARLDPGPENLGPLGAHLVSDDFGWCSGQVLFAGGSEVAVVDRPRLLEVVRADEVASLEGVLRAVIPRAFAKAESAQATDGGANPRFGPIFDEPARVEAAVAPVTSCAVVSDRPGMAAAITAALEARSVACHAIDVAADFAAAAGALQRAVDHAGPIDALVVALAGGGSPASPGAGREQLLADHRELVPRLHADAAWSRAVADYAAGTARPIRVVTLTDATTPSGRSRAQAAAQQARVAAGATEGRVAAFAASIEASETAAAPAAGELVFELLCNPDAAPLAGAELAVGSGWIGLRSHPRPIGAVTYGGPAVPEVARQRLAGHRP